MTKSKREPTADPLGDLRRLIRAEGAQDAYQALREVCRNKEAAPNARATAGAAIFRAAGLFERTDDGEGKEGHELTGAELAHEIAMLEAEQARRETASDDIADDGPDVFG